MNYAKFAFRKVAKVAGYTCLNVCVAMGAAFVVGYLGITLLEDVPSASKVVQDMNMDKDLLLQAVAEGTMKATFVGKMAWDLFIKKDYKKKYEAAMKCNVFV